MQVKPRWSVYRILPQRENDKIDCQIGELSRPLIILETDTRMDAWWKLQKMTTYIDVIHNFVILQLLCLYCVPNFTARVTL